MEGPEEIPGLFFCCGNYFPTPNAAVAQKKHPCINGRSLSLKCEAE
jgi:hypothetical protein